MIEDQNLHKLYRLPASRYVDYAGTGELPPELEAYVQSHRGEYPPYMALPSVATEFDTGGIRSVRWSGKGPLPEDVMSYVCEHGTLPRQKKDALFDIEVPA